MGTFVLSYKNVTHTQWSNSREGTDGYAMFIPVYSKNPNSNNNSNRSTREKVAKSDNKGNRIMFSTEPSQPSIVGQASNTGTQQPTIKR